MDSRESLSWTTCPEQTFRPLSRGGLSPALTHRICKYIESHLAERISLEALASMAGLSTHHFARAFRQSLGAPPHGYLLRRRSNMLSSCSMRLGCRYPKLLSPRDFPTTSHLSRHFRRFNWHAPKSRAPAGTINPIARLSPRSQDMP